MCASGAVYRQPLANPAGRSPARHGLASRPSSQSGGTGGPAAPPPARLAGALTGGGGPRVPCTPVTGRTPVAGSAASSRSTARVSRPHRVTRALSSTRCDPQIAAATEDVVSAGGAAARMTTRAPASARQIAVVSPVTPAPTTRTSQSFGTQRRYRGAAGPRLPDERYLTSWR